MHARGVYNAAISVISHSSQISATGPYYQQQPVVYRVCQKVTPFWYLSFLPLLDALFAIFVYLHIIFIKWLISEPSVVSIQMDSPAGWCTIAHCEQHDKLPQKG